MGRLVGPPLSASEKEFIQKQRIFFTASAPLSSVGHINVSPKSAFEFRIVNDIKAAYLDYSGSGSETAAHIIENKRLTMLFVAFEGSPKIVRLYGEGKLILIDELSQPGNEIYQQLFVGLLPGQANYNAGLRCIITLDLERVTTSCGYSIPFYNYISERPTLLEFSEKKGDQGMIDYRSLKNSWSIDGLPSIGQILKKELPSSIKHENGYIFAVYGGGLLAQWTTYYSMYWQYQWKSGRLLRDIFMLATGALMTGSIVFGYGKWTSRR